MDWEQIRQHLVWIVKERGLTQDEVAVASGKPQSTTSRMLGRRQVNGPYLMNFVRLLEGLGLKPSEFFRAVEGGTRTSGDRVTVPEVAKLRLKVHRMLRAFEAFEDSLVRPHRPARKRKHAR